MQEPNDKTLHDWVRQTLQTYQPAPQPQDWIRMQRKLRYKFWWRLSAYIGIGCVLLFVCAWWFSKDIIPSTQVQEKVSNVEIMPDLENNIENSIQVNPVPKTDTLSVIEENGMDHRLFVKPRVGQISSLQLTPLIASVTRNILLTEAEDLLPQVSKPLFSLEENDIRYQMQTGDFGSDSTSYQVFSRNIRKWPEAVVICDLTTSMYPYSTQIFAWLRKNSKNPNIKAVVFFTDCDSTGQETKSMEFIGQMFVSTSLKAENVLPVMIRAARNTVRNGNSEENDMEALLFAQQRFPEAKHLILLADNSSAVKDMALLEKLKKPVHVILCGSAADSTQAFQPEYRDIALHTKGSLHTMEDDLNPGQEKKQPWLQVGERFYKYDVKKKRYKLTRFRYRPRHILGLFWW